jgi:parallel beta-helix repeat protein
MILRDYQIRQYIFIFLTIISCLVASATQANAINIYVSPKGNDNWTGRLPKPNDKRNDGPIATLFKARNIIREIKAKGSLKSDLHVIVSGGRYSMMQTLQLEPIDSGTNTAQVIYEAEPNAKPIFSGGYRIIPKSENKNIWATHIPEVSLGKWFFEQLWVNSKRAVRARTPNTGFFNIVEKAPDKPYVTNIQKIDVSKQAFVANPKDVKWLIDLTPQKMSEARLVAYHSWEVSLLPVCCIQSTENVIITAGSSQWPFLSFGKNQRYFLENIKRALDLPGEWYLQNDGNLFYIPKLEENINSAEIIAPKLEKFIEIKGNLNHKVENITIKGLSFQYAQYLLPKDGVSDGQAASSIPAVVVVDYADSINFLDNEIAHIGTNAVWLRRGTNNIRIEKNYFHDLGAGGVRIGEVSIPSLKADQTGHNTVQNNIIQSGGRIFPGAIGIWIGQSGDNIVSHNEISDLYYSGISVGWTWGYGQSLAKRNIISFNHIYSIGQMILSDLGGIYTLGISDGTIINNNLIHDIYSYDGYGRGGWGIYNDEGSSNIIVENNLVYNTKTGGYHLHYGRNNTVRNNIFALAFDGQIQKSRAENHLSLTFKNNIIFWDKSYLFNGFWSSKDVILSQNLFWLNNGNSKLFTNKNESDLSLIRQDSSSIIANPLFLDIGKYDFRIPSASPSNKINFKSFDYKKAGVNANLKWHKK